MSADETKWTRDRMAKFLDITPRHLNYLAQNGVVPSPVAGEWQAAACVVKYIRHLRDAAGSHNKEDKGRKLKAEADNAELEGMKLRNEVVMMDSAKAWWADGRIEIKQAIARVDFLNASQKARLFGVLSKIRTKPLEA